MLQQINNVLNPNSYSFSEIIRSAAGLCQDMRMHKIDMLQICSSPEKLKILQ